MFKHPVFGQLGLVVGVLVLCSACVAGEIGDASGSARLAPEASDPEIGNDVAPLVCPGASPSVSAQNGWQSREASLPADGALRFELKARPTAANLDGLVAVGAEDIDHFAKAAIAVRFSDNGLVDVRDGAFYSSDVAYPYDPGVWYSIAISTDIDAQTYDVEIGPCGEPREMLIRNASFRDGTSVNGQLSEWAVWSSQSAALETSTPAWMNSEGCASATCASLGHACGTPEDGCGGALSCGVCGDGEMCSNGTCIDAPANALPPPPPSCTPATCQSLGNQCGQWGDGCGGVLSCGSCSGGQTCSAGLCIDAPPNVPPPPACTPATCQSLGNQCGQWGDGCGGIVSCGSCSAGEMCSNGTCIAAPATSSNWWDNVAKPNATNTGPNCSAPGCPNATLLPQNAPPSVITQDGATYENFIVTSGDTFIVEADNVTFRNFRWELSGSGWRSLYTNGSRLVMEYGEFEGTGANCNEFIFGQGFTARYMKLHSCDDMIKINTDYGTGPTVIENSYMYDSVGGHGDTIMLWPSIDADVTFRHNHLEGGNTSVFIDDTIIAPAKLLVEENWLHGGGAAYTVYCSSAGGGARIYQNNLFDRNYLYGAVADRGCTWINNRWMDNFGPVPYNP